MKNNRPTSLFLICGLAGIFTLALLAPSAQASTTLSLQVSAPTTAAIGDTIHYVATVTNTGASTATGVYSAFGPDNSADVGCDPAHPQGSCDKYTTFVSSNPSPFFTDQTNYRYLRLKDQNGVSINDLAAGQSGTFDVYYTASANGTANRPFTAASPDVPLGQQIFVQTTVGTVVVSTDPQMMTVTVQPSTAKVGVLRKYHGEVYNDGPDNASGLAIGIQADSQDQGGHGFDTYETFNSSNPPPNFSENPDANGIRFISLPDIPAKSSITFDAYYTTAQNGIVQRNFFLRVPAADNDSNTSNNHFVVSSSISASAPDQLSATLLTVNGSSSVSALPNDLPIVFEATQGDTKDKVKVRIQSATNDDPVWRDLETGLDGQMVFNVHDNKWILTTGNYPINVHTYFRAVATMANQESESNEIGPFTVASSKTHLPGTVFNIEGMMERFLVFIAAYPLNFTALNTSTASGLSLHLQSTTTPEVEGSWSNVTSGSLASLGNGVFNVRTGTYPSGSGIYFRTVASANNSGDSISNYVGPFQLTANTLPQVTITSPSGNGTDASPLRVSNSAGKTFVFSATGADPNGSVAKMELFDNGNKKTSVASNSTSTTLNLGQGRHTLKAVATDNSEAKSFAEVVVEVAPPASGPITYSLTTSGSWNTAGNWTPNGVPGALDTANLGGNTASIPSGTTITVASLSGGNITGAAASSKVIVTKNFTWTGGTISHATVEVANGGNGLIKGTPGGSDFTFNTTNFINDGGGTITVDVDSITLNNIKIHGSNTCSTLVNSGNLYFSSPTLLAQTQVPNQTAEERAALIAFAEGLAAQKFQGLASITNKGGGHIYLNAANFDFSGAGSCAANTAGVSDPAAPAAAVGLIQEGGVLDFGPLNQAGTIIGDVVINGGTVTGSGAIFGNLTNNGGLIMPGHSGGVLVVTGNYSQGANGTLQIEVGGPNANNPDYDQLQVGGTATLDGALNVQSINGFTADGSATLVPLSYASSSGSFSSLSSNASANIGATGTTLNVFGANPPTGRPANISTRMKVLIDDQVLIGGFIVKGPSGSTKNVLIRGIGPSLANFGLTGVLSDPLLELHKPDGSTVTNDNWGDAPNKDQIPNNFKPSSPQESAILADLAPGAYTVIEKGAHGETGIGLTEIYDMDGSSTVALANISTRGFIDSGDNVMIGGFIVGGTQPAQILVRAIGPSLKNFGLTGVLEDPVLEVHDANGNFLTNDDWRETQESEIIASTVAPSDDHEPAILATLVPGGYTAIVRGKDNTTGVGSVEAYKIK